MAIPDFEDHDESGSGSFDDFEEEGSGHYDCDDEDGSCGDSGDSKWPWDSTSSTSSTTTTTTQKTVDEDIAIIDEETVDVKENEIDSGSQSVATVKAIVSILLPTAVCWLGHWMADSTVQF